MFHCINPLTIGYICSPSSEPHTSKDKQDGFISAIIIFCLVIGLSLALGAAHFITCSQNDIEVKEVYLHVLLMCYMLVAMATMLYLMKNDTNLDISVPHVAKKPQQKCAAIQRCFGYSVTLFGLVCLTVVSAVLDALRASCHLTCMSTFFTCGLGYKYILKVVFGLVRLSMQVILAAFCLKYYHQTFLRCPLVRYGILAILAASASNWFTSILYDSHGSLGTNNTCKDTMSVNLNVQQCLNESTKWYEAVDLIAEPFHPVSLRIQLLLLSSQILVKFFFDAVDSNKFRKLKEHPQGRDWDSPSTDGSHTKPDTNNSVNEHGLSQNASSLQNMSSNMPVPNSEDDATEQGSADEILCPSDKTTLLKTSALKSRKGFWVKLYLLLAKTKCLIWVILAILFVPHIVLGQLHESWLCTYLVYTRSLLTASCVIYILTLVTVRGLPTEHRPFTGFEITACLCSMGFIIHVWITVIATVSLLREGKNHRLTKELWLALPMKFIVSLHIILQAEVMIQTARLELLLNPETCTVPTQVMEMPRREATLSGCFQLKCKRILLRHIVLLMAAMNLTLWISDNELLEDKANSFYKILVIFFNKSHYATICDITKPLVLFYRFSCGMIFVKTYFREH